MHHNIATFHLYTISGMGLNELLFSKLNLNVSDIHHIKWIEPLSQQESLESYARRMSEQIHHEENVVLLGVSFGGIMAKTIAKFRKIEKIIIISSLKSAEEKPLTFEMAALMPIPLHRITPLALKKATLPLWAPLFGLNSRAEQEFFGKMMNLTSEFYKNWATTQITQWKDNEPSHHIYHIHGDKDQIFPIKHIKRARIVKGGDHAMVVKRADEVSQLINQALHDYVHYQVQSNIHH
ncbi:MAG: hypothetical protein OHK0038_27510 [Flammeovirgaceae bacterium]